VSLRVLERLQTGERALVPSFWSLEILNSRLIGEKRGRISKNQTRTFLGDLEVLSPRFDYAPMDLVCGPVQKLCRDHRLTPYDAIYVELARRANCPLVTQDQAQKDATQALKIQCLERGEHARQ
jgi:predicted nucleic acid-binding protein